MTRRPKRPQLDPVIPETPTEAELAAHRQRAEHYRALRVIPLASQTTPALDPAMVARDAFPATAWGRARAQKRTRTARVARLAAISVGLMAFALRDTQLRYRLVPAGPTRPLPPAA